MGLYFSLHFKFVYKAESFFSSEKLTVDSNKNRNLKSMTIFARNNRKNKVEEPKYTSSPIAPPVSPAYVPNRTNKALAPYNTSQSDEQEDNTEKKKKPSDKKKMALDKDETTLDKEDKATEKKEKVPKYKIICLPLDTRSGRVLLVTKADNSNIWVLVSDNQQWMLCCE